MKTGKQLKNNRISVYVRNKTFGPSDYYRVVQYMNKLNADIIVHDALPDKLFQKNIDLKPSIKKKGFQAILFIIIYCRRIVQMIGDLNKKVQYVVIQREVFPRFMPEIAGRVLNELLKNSIVIWDFDDDIILDGEITKSERNILEKSSSKIIVTSNYLKKKIRQEYQSKVILLPTSDSLAEGDEIRRLLDERSKEYDRMIRFVWIGTASNLRNIDLVFCCIEKIGEELKFAGKEIELDIVCNIPYERRSDVFSVKNIQWTRKMAEEVARNAHIGIMPLVDEEYSKGKGGFKLIQFMSCGLAVVASSVGFNKEILKNESDGFCCDNADEWEKAIRLLTTDKSAWRFYSENAYRNYLKNYDRKNNERIWKTVLGL